MISLSELGVGDESLIPVGFRSQPWLFNSLNCLPTRPETCMEIHSPQCATFLRARTFGIFMAGPSVAMLMHPLRPFLWSN